MALAWVDPALIREVDELLSVPAQEWPLTLDARGAEDYGDGQLPGAVSLPTTELEGDRDIPFRLLPYEALEQRLRAAGVESGVPVLVYDRGGDSRAARLFWILELCGVDSAAVINGGLAAWTAAGGELSRAARTPTPGSLTVRPRTDRFADYDRVLASADARLCNTLGAQRFRAEHIPGSTNMPFQELFGPDGCLEPAVAADSFRRAGLAPEHETIFYCQAGYTACVGYLAARLLGFPRVRMYDGSLLEWRARGGPLASLPIPPAASLIGHPGSG